jgi:hypothetical protein
MGDDHDVRVDGRSVAERQARFGRDLVGLTGEPRRMDLRYLPTLRERSGVIQVCRASAGDPHHAGRVDPHPHTRQPAISSAVRRAGSKEDHATKGPWAEYRRRVGLVPGHRVRARTRETTHGQCAVGCRRLHV